MNQKSFVALLLFAIISLASLSALATTPNILVTLKPLHALVSGLTHGINQPTLLMAGLQSPHEYQLKPSELRLLQSADIIIYAGDQIESFIPSMKITGNKQLVALDALPGMPLLPARGSRTSHTADHTADHDGHIWLSPVNARVIVQQLAEILANHDAVHRAQYFDNRDRMLLKLDALQKQILQQLQPVQTQPFLQFHDALQYFERDFSLSRSIVVTSGTEHSPGARHIRLLQQRVRDEKIRCFVYEPPHAPKLLQTLDVNHNANMQPLEIHGSDLLSGEELYFTLLVSIASKLQTCLQPDKDQKR